MNVRDALYEAMERAGIARNEMDVDYHINMRNLGDGTKILQAVKIASICGYSMYAVPRHNVPEGSICITDSAGCKPGEGMPIPGSDGLVWAVESMRQVGTHLEAVFDNKRDALKALSKAAEDADGWFRVRSFDMSDEKQKRALATALKMTEL